FACYNSLVHSVSARHSIFSLGGLTLAVSRAQWPERGTSGGYCASAPVRGSRKPLTRPCFSLPPFDHPCTLRCFSLHTDNASTSEGGHRMTPLRHQMIVALQRSGKGERTQASSIREVRLLAQFYHKAPDRISEQELQAYFLHRK